MLTVSEEWRKVYPGASAGLLVVEQVFNPLRSEELEREKQEAVKALQSRFKNRNELLCFEPLRLYDEYYRRFKKTYHVRQQIESVIFKNKPIPSVAALVEAMFMAELKNGLLTAGHDLNSLKPPLSLSVGKVSDFYTGMGGKPIDVKADDMMISDQTGIISSILGGPDLRTKITPDTRNAVFAVYAPAGISDEMIELHFDDIIRCIRLVSTKAYVAERRIFR